MPHPLLGWLRGGLPGRPRQETRGRGSTGQHKVVAPPAGGAGVLGEGSGDGKGLPPGGDDSSPAASDSSRSRGPVSSKPFAVAGTLGAATILSTARNWGFLVKALTVHSANLAAQLGARPLQPLQERLQQQLAGMTAVQEACRQLQVESLSDLQDLMNCIILSEHVYKIVDHSTETSVSMINNVKAEFPPQMVTLRNVQWAEPHVRHRFLLGESHDALYVSFMGTKLPRDMATNANLFQEEVILDAAMLSSGASAANDSTGSGSGGAGSGRTLAAHRGFLARARSIPIHSLYQEARARGKRLVLCGHSLGGAVASLCAIQLLQGLPPNLHHTVSCYGFATPAIGNDALAATVVECGWDARIRNYLSPDDPIPRLLSFRRPPAEKPIAADSSAPTAAALLPPAGTAIRAAAEAVPSAASAASKPQHAAIGDGGSSGGSGRAHLSTVAPSAPTAAASDAGASAGANNIKAAPKLAASGRLHRIASHVGASSSKEEQQPRFAMVGGSTSSRPSILRSTSSPALLPGAAATAAAAAVGARVSKSLTVGEQIAVEASPAGSAGAAAAVSAAVAAAVLQESASPHLSHAEGSTEAVSSSSSKPRRQYWLGQRLAEAAAPPLRAAAQAAGSVAMAAAAPPMRAVVERAGSAARLVAVPLSAAASVPMRAAPQYLPLGRQLHILPSTVSTTAPSDDKDHGGGGASQAGAAAASSAAAAPAAPVVRHWANFWRPAAAGPAAAAQDGDGSSLDDDDIVAVVVAAAASLTADPAVVAAAPAATEGEESAAAGRKKRRALFEAHRMATYRNRLVGICQGSLEGHLLLRSLPMLPNLPRPGDVAASELVAPPMFPLRAVASLEPSAVAAAAATFMGTSTASSTAKQAAAGTAQSATAPASSSHAHPASGQQRDQAQQQQKAGGLKPANAARQLGFWQRLLARAGQQPQEPPVELYIRVDGKGLANVTQAWIEGVPTAPSSSAAGGAEGKPHSSSMTSLTEVTILQQPQSPLLPLLKERPQLPVIGQLSAFVSWLAVTLGWVALLRQLQPAGCNDYLLARVRLPAAAVRSAQKAAQNNLLSSVTDGPLLHGLHLGPRLSLRLQSDFAVHSLPVDIRVAADLQAQQHRWQWPWQRRQQLLHQGSRWRGQQQAQPQKGSQRPALKWWEWPPAGGATDSSPAPGQ